MRRPSTVREPIRGGWAPVAAPARTAIVLRPRAALVRRQSAAETRLLQRMRAAVALRAQDATSPRTNEQFAAVRASLTDLVDELKARELSLAQAVVCVDLLTRDARLVPCRAQVLAWTRRAYRDDEWW